MISFLIVGPLALCGRSPTATAQKTTATRQVAANTTRVPIPLSHSKRWMKSIFSNPLKVSYFLIAINYEETFTLAQQNRPNAKAKSKALETKKATLSKGTTSARLLCQKARILQDNNHKGQLKYTCLGWRGRSLLSRIR